MLKDPVDNHAKMLVRTLALTPVECLSEVTVRRSAGRLGKK